MELPREYNFKKTSELFLKTIFIQGLQEIHLDVFFNKLLLNLCLETHLARLRGTSSSAGTNGYAKLTASDF